MIIVNGGVPRSGTVFVNAVIRFLLNDRVTQWNAHERELTTCLRDIRRGPGQTAAPTALIHTHSWNQDAAALLVDQPDVTGFLNYRDPRDVCVSLMRLHDLDVAEATGYVLSAYSAFERAAADTGWMLIRYEQLVEEPAIVVDAIATELGVSITSELIEECIEHTSIERHRRHMQRVANGELSEIVERPNSRRRLREDPTTLINDRHIQSGAVGRWRDELTDAARTFVSQRLEPIIAGRGYST